MSATLARFAAMLHEGHYVVLDTETTGLDRASEVIEVAVVDAAGHTLLDTLVRPAGPIPWQASQVHGITLRDVAFAPQWAHVAPRLARLLAGRMVVVYNADFDRRLLAQTDARHHTASLPDGAMWWCAMRAYSAYYAARTANTRWQGLAKAMTQCGLPWPDDCDAHRARADALATVRLCRHLAQALS